MGKDCPFNKLPGDADALGPQTGRSNEDFEVRIQTLSQNKDLMGEKLPGALTLWLLIILLFSQILSHISSHFNFSEICVWQSYKTKVQLLSRQVSCDIWVAI